MANASVKANELPRCSLFLFDTSCNFTCTCNALPAAQSLPVRLGQSTPSSIQIACGRPSRCVRKNRPRAIGAVDSVGRPRRGASGAVNGVVCETGVHPVLFYSSREGFSMRSGAADKHLDTNVARVGRQHYSRRSKTRSIHNRCQHLMHRNLTQPCWRQF